MQLPWPFAARFPRGRVGVPEGWEWSQRRGKEACRKARGAAFRAVRGAPPPRARRRAALLFLRRFAFPAGRFGRACTKMTISCEGTVFYSTYITITWNNSHEFHVVCDTIGTGKVIYWRPSPFLHNLSSILYRGEAALGALTALLTAEFPNSASLPRLSPAHVRLDTPR